MPDLKSNRLIRILPQTDLGRSVAAFLVDRQARGLSPHTVDFYASELHYLQAYLERRGVSSVQDTTAHLLRRYLLDLGQHRKPGGVHAAYRAMRAFLKWYMVEYEPVGWSNPILKVAAPRVPFEALEPVSLSDLRAMLATCDRRQGGLREVIATVPAVALALPSAGRRLVVDRFYRDWMTLEVVADTGSLYLRVVAPQEQLNALPRPAGFSDYGDMAITTQAPGFAGMF